jgi:hypothetical protein
MTVSLGEIILYVKKIFISNVTYDINEQGRRVSGQPIFQRDGILPCLSPAGGGLRGWISQFQHFKGISRKMRNAILI